jgi:hypothetical protein
MKPAGESKRTAISSAKTALQAIRVVAKEVFMLSDTGTR